MVKKVVNKKTKKVVKKVVINKPQSVLQQIKDILKSLIGV